MFVLLLLAELDPAKSSLVVPSSLLVLERGKQEQLKFDERDKYGNLVMSSIEDLLNYEFIFHEVGIFLKLLKLGTD